MADTCETVKIMPSHESQGAFVEINAEDFDPKVHKLFDEGAADEDDDAGLTKAEIIADLEGMGVEFDPRAKKADLLAQRNEARAARDAAKPDGEE